jgi:drug/metabolite transporter (DMT)-like permease
MDGKSGFSQSWPGAPLAFASAALFGVTAPLSKILLAAFDPQLLAGALYLGAGIGLASVSLGRCARKMPAAEAPLRRADLPWLAVIVLTGGVIGPLALMQGLKLTSAANASLLLNLEGLATMAIAWVVFRENVDARLLSGAAAILCGAALLSWQGWGLSLDSGALLVAGACLAWGIDNNLTRKLSSADPVSIATVKGLVAGGVNVAAALFLRGAVLPAPDSMMLAALLGFVGIGVSLVLFILALRHLGTARTGAYFSLAPFIGALAAIFLLHEAPTLRLAVAGVLMAFGVWLHLSERHEHEHEHEPLEHEHAHVHDEHHRHDHEGPVVEPHAHRHVHARLVHGHPHYPDLHHRHGH